MNQCTFKCVFALVNTAFMTLWLSACGTVGTPGSTGNSPVNAPLIDRPSAGASALREGVAALNSGEYGKAEKKLTESFKLGLSNSPDLIQGYKTQAFVYCATARMAQCEKSFEAAFSVDRKFNLTPSEKQQPVWGPVFTKVQKRYAP